MSDINKILKLKYRDFKLEAAKVSQKFLLLRDLVAELKRNTFIVNIGGKISKGDLLFLKKAISYLKTTVS